MPCNHEINEYKQNRLPLETSFAKFSVTTNFLFNSSSLHTLIKGIFHDITIYDNNRKTHVESTRAMTRERGSRAESKNCEILLFPTAERRFGTKVKCPTGRASFLVKFPTVRSLTRVKCPGIARGGAGEVGGFGINWFIIAVSASVPRPLFCSLPLMILLRIFCHATATPGCYYLQHERCCEQKPKQA